MSGESPVEPQDGGNDLNTALRAIEEKLNELNYDPEAEVRRELDTPTSVGAGAHAERLSTEDQLKHIEELRLKLNGQAPYSPEIVRQMHGLLTGIEYCVRTIDSMTRGDPGYMHEHLCVLRYLQRYVALWARLREEVRDFLGGYVSKAHWYDIYALSGIASVINPRKEIAFVDFKGTPNSVPVEVDGTEQDLAWGAASLLLQLLKQGGDVAADDRVGDKLLAFLMEHGHGDSVTETPIDRKKHKASYRTIGGLEHFISCPNEIRDRILKR